ncbi:MAG: ATP-dependent DNA helicase RecG [Bowdeniella nasicola]|nr:ATP-dependent DNA helicase RecG [Bowdeniella nasicola]
MSAFLRRPLTDILGASTAKKLATLGLHTVEDFVWHIPHRYVHPGMRTPLADVPEGMKVLVTAEILDVSARPVRGGRRHIVTIVISDGSMTVPAVFFAPHRGRVAYYQERYRPGTTAFFSGVFSRYRGQLQLTHPTVEPYGAYDDPASALRRATALVPVYYMTSALSPKAMETCAHTILDSAGPDDIPDVVPAEVRADLGLRPLLDSVRAVHLIGAPADPEEAEVSARQGRHELRFTEAFVLQALLARRRASVQAAHTRPRPGRRGGLLDAFDARLPFTLTEGQRAVGEEISQDLARETPMLRLLQGDVGSGKTLVALRAMAQVVDSGGQAVLLAPTEVLAHQHYLTITSMLGDLAGGGLFSEQGTRVTLVTGSQSAAERRRTRAEIASGEAGLIIGTHALFSDDVAPADLGLVVVDEQHRFGVEQRDRLRGAGEGGVHMLHMTATPIPRTIALTVFGDLETSTLAEAPAGRAEVVTHRVPIDNEVWVARMWERIGEELEGGGRAFVVCPRIDAEDEKTEGVRPDGDDGPEDGETLPLASVLQTAADLESYEALSRHGIAILHGRMSPEHKAETMAAFAAGKVRTLVSTTVIEVGVDVPEASVMVIMNPERFGLAQLHQLRGRIGRGTRPGVCFLLDPTVSAHDPQGNARLAAFAATTDGFALAEEDLALRREGDVLGSRQSGARSGLRVLSALADRDTIERARTHARAVIAADPTLAAHPTLAEAIAAREAEASYLERT